MTGLVKKTTAMLAAVCIFIGILSGADFFGFTANAEAVDNPDLGGEADGGQNDPYIINEAEDFKWITDNISTASQFRDKYFIQTKDIDLSGFGNWTPISPFYGTYDGQGHKVYNLTYSGTALAGFFGQVGQNANATIPNVPNSVVKNLRVEGELTSSGILGGIAGRVMTGSSIIGCSFSGTITGTNTVGGIAGLATGTNANNASGQGILSNCCNEGTVISSGGIIGGIAGTGNISISNCHNTGNISGKAAESAVGGIIGNLTGNLAVPTYTVENCYNIGTVENNNSTYAGSIVGNADASDSTFTNNFYLDTTASGTNGIGSYDESFLGDLPQSKTSDDLKNSTAYSSWSDFNKNWSITSENGGYPHLKTVPSVSIDTEITGYTPNAATFSGTFGDGESSVSEIGFEYKEIGTGSTVYASKVSDSADSVDFTADLSGLSADTEYYIRAYAVNALGKTCSDYMRFKTLAGPATDSIIAPAAADFDKFTDSPSFADVQVTMTLNGNELRNIKNGLSKLVLGTDYTVLDNAVTIKKEYLAGQPLGITSLSFNFNAGSRQTLSIDIADTTPHNSTITPTTASFDKKTSEQADIQITMTFNGNTLSNIKNGSDTLVPDTDYSVSGNVVTINKSYFVSQSLGTTTLTFNFSGGNPQSLAVTVTDTTPGNSSITPTTASFDKKTSEQADIQITMTFNGNTLSNIKNGSDTLVPDTDYSVSGNVVKINKSYFVSQSLGTTTLTFNFSGGNPQILSVNVIDTTPHNSSITPIIASFDKYTGSSDYEDIEVEMTLNGNTLESIENGSDTLVEDTDYEISGDEVTIYKEYLETLPTGTETLTFNFSAGASAELEITVSDTTPNNSSINPTSASFDKYTGSSDYDDIKVEMTLNGNTLESIENGSDTLVEDSDYEVSGNEVTIYKEYLETLPTGTETLTFNFNAGASAELEITVSDTTPNSSSIDPTSVSFDKDTDSSDYDDIEIEMTLNGNTLESIENGSNTLDGGSDYDVSGEYVTIYKEYLETLPTGTETLTFNFSAGASAELEITVSDTTPNNSSINPTSASFDKYTDSSDYEDIEIEMTLNGNTLESIENGSNTLDGGSDYDVSGEYVTIYKEYLETLPTGTETLTFNFSAGASAELEIDITESSSAAYTVTFDKNGGDTNANPRIISVLPGDDAGTLPTEPTRAGYTFTGWNTEEDGTGDSFTAGTEVFGDITVYAQWEISDTPIITTANPITTEVTTKKPRKRERRKVTEATTTEEIKIIKVIEAPESIENSEFISVVPLGPAFDESVEVIIKDDDETRSVIRNALDGKFPEISDDISVFPLDISLYIKGTNTKIQPNADTSVEITCPIPLDLLTDRDNIKVVCVIDGKLQVLPTRLLIKNDVYCVVFTASHFSPYAIVVDNEGKLSNLAAGAKLIDTATPISADGIPYLLIAVGLAVLGIIVKKHKAKQ